ncbi:MAG TPA: sigma 54-interacting transcriptional regulator [Kofleriaceae bacterium]
MPRVHVEAAGSSSEELVELADREAAVFGRNPDGKQVAAKLELGAAREIRLPSPSVSSNHVAVWVDAREVRVRDLGSRNGSWVRLPSDVTVTLPDDDVQLRLGFPRPPAHIERTIDAPSYETADDYGRAIAQAIGRWLGERGVQMTLTVSSDDQPPLGALAVPLASGETLTVLSPRTIEDSSQNLLLHIARYVAAQNALYVAEQDTLSDGMVLASAAIRQVHRRVVDAALHNVTRVVLLGPSGTGKERLARAYHRHLARSGPLVTVNCATLSRDRIVADLFGAEAGAYTGAQRAIVGAVERADGGTLFLDEVGEMPLEVQSQLLRFLDTGEYQRLGATGVTRHADIHVVVATNRDLRQMVNEGTFRLDLFFRIALEVIEVPSLRARFKDAIAYLASFSLGTTNALEALQPAALDALRAHAWAGNFRELVNLAMRLPRDASRESVDAETVTRLLGAGGLLATPAPAPQTTSVAPAGWTDWLRDSAAAYCADTGTTGPSTWGEMTAFIEQYLKPHALVHMANVADAASENAIAVSKVAEAVKADRGTVIKQVRRYFQSRR